MEKPVSANVLIPADKNIISFSVKLKDEVTLVQYPGPQTGETCCKVVIDHVSHLNEAQLLQSTG